MQKKGIKSISGIDPKQLERGIKDEMREHPWAGKRGATRIATDHIKKHPYMYKKS